MELHSYAKQCKHINRLIVENLEPKIVKLFFRGPLISDARNEIAHTGKSSKYKIVTLMDSWYPFDFVRRWVACFDVNFDNLIFYNRETKLIKDYKVKLNKIK